MKYKPIFILIILIILAGCSQKQEEPIITETLSLIKLLPEQYPHFKDDRQYTDIDKSIVKSLSYLKRVNSNKEFAFGEDTYTASYLIESLQTFQNFIATKPSEEQLNQFIKTKYKVYQAAGRDSEKNLLVTGYFEPLLKGSLKKTKDFTIPLYAIPKDLIFVNLADFSEELKGKKISGKLVKNRLKPYYDRYDIEYNNAIFNKAEKLAWIQNRIDRFFLEIQGSGKVILENGEIINIHYHATNGRKYQSIGTLLIREGKIKPKEMSMQAIYEYLQKNSQEIKKVLPYNKNFVFFKTEKEGPIGCISVALTPMRSIATDRKIFPQAALAYIQTYKPTAEYKENKNIEWEEMNLFVQNQDTGGAIKGAGRADFFWGNGDYAKLAAGHMQHKGKLFFLVLKKEP
ncbi:MAG: MltA domain-containing protein [Deltaproteobacteria bacterium]|nr:MltA domain-containing protein [Deltaproteobacteria bacterium]